MINSVLKVIQGWVKIKGGSTGSFIGNVEDKLKVHAGNLDFFGNQTIALPHNQVEVPLDDTNWQDFVTITQSSTGAASQANGQVTFTTGTNANGRYAAISAAVKYRPNNEIGFGFTWAFPTPSAANVTLRIGATDNITTWANSVYFSHSNGVFSLIYNRGGVEIFNAQRSTWIDKCDGSSGSKYRNMAGTPVAMDVTKDQLARIRCGLFGHAGFVVEVLSPDQNWVTIYKYSNLNSVAVAIFSNFDLSIGAEVKKVAAGAGVYTLISACWGGWTGSSFQRINSSINDRTLAQVTRTVIEGRSSSGGGTYVPVKVNPSGSLQVVDDLVETNTSALLARSSGSILSGIDWNYFSVAYPNNTTDVYTYRQGGATGTIVRTVTITYTSATRDKIATCGYV